MSDTVKRTRNFEVRRPSGRRLGFTLIELLVVITIIVILLALLTPALDKAIYQAELAVCMAQQRGVASGSLTYAATNKRSYPYRPTHGENKDEGSPNNIRRAIVDFPDDRPALRTFININALLDPLVAEVNLDTNDPDSYVYQSTWLYFGFGFTGHRGMYKVGDRFSWTYNDLDSGETRTARFKTLTSDEDFVEGISGGYRSSHPDADGILTNRSWDDGDRAVLTDAVTQQMSASLWLVDGEGVRGSLDLHYAYDDASVERFNDVVPDDPRTIPIPEFRGADNHQDGTGNRQRLPER